MKRILTALLVPFLLAASGVNAADTGNAGLEPARQTVDKNGSQGSFAGPESFFTGRVKVDMLFSPTKELPASGACVTFEPGARSAWHTHPAGQILIVTSGIGLTREWGGPLVEIRPGDVVRCPVGVKHWHGAAPDSWFQHLAVEVPGERCGNEWCEPVSDEIYKKLK